MGPAEAACSQRVFLRLFICGLAALQYRPYHHNGHKRENTTKEHIQHIVRVVMGNDVHVNDVSLVCKACVFYFPSQLYISVFSHPTVQTKVQPKFFVSSYAFDCLWFGFAVHFTEVTSVGCVSLLNVQVCRKVSDVTAMTF